MESPSGLLPPRKVIMRVRMVTTVRGEVIEMVMIRGEVIEMVMIQGEVIEMVRWKTVVSVSLLLRQDLGREDDCVTEIFIKKTKHLEICIANTLEPHNKCLIKASKGTRKLPE